MADFPTDNSVPESETVSYFNGQVKIVIELDIPRFSTLKARTEYVRSKRVIIGMSAWSLHLRPLDNPDASERSRVSSVCVKHECLTMDLAKISATYKISVLDANNKRHLQADSTRTFMPPSDIWGDDVSFKHTDIWGPKPTLILKDDTLKLIAEISYDSVKHTHHDLFEPLEQKLQVFYDAAEDDVTLMSSDGCETKVNRSILQASSSVFSSMLKSNMVEFVTGRCKMADVSEATMDSMVDFMLYNKMSSLTVTARNVLVAADKYQIGNLKVLCEKVLGSELTDETAAELLILADTVSAPTLKTAALRYIAANLKSMTASSHLKELTDSGDGKLFGEILAAVALHGSPGLETTTNCAKKVTGKPRKRKTAEQ